MNDVLEKLEKLFEAASEDFDRANEAYHKARDQGIRVARSLDCATQNGIMRACLTLRPLVKKAIAEAPTVPVPDKTQ